MIIVHIFLALVWMTMIVGTLIGGLTISVRYAVDADIAGVRVLPALAGTVGRALLTLAVVAVLMGLPLIWLGF